MAFVSVTGIFWSQNYDGTEWIRTTKEGISINSDKVVSIVEITGTGIKSKDGKERDGDFLLNLDSIFANQLEVSPEDADNVKANAGSLSPKAKGEVEDILEDHVENGISVSDEEYEFVMENKNS